MAKKKQLFLTTKIKKTAFLPSPKSPFAHYPQHKKALIFNSCEQTNVLPAELAWHCFEGCDGCASA